MIEFKQLKNDEELMKFIEIISNAYVGLRIDTIEDKKKTLENLVDTLNTDDITQLIGAYKGDEMVGGMRFDDFKMRLLTQDISIGGLGFVAVDFLHKKQGVAKAIVTEFIEYYDSVGYPLVALYPFRPDFYKKMGFGFGTNMTQYRFDPAAFRKSTGDEFLKYLSEDDIPQMRAIYEKMRESRNGLFEKTIADYNRFFAHKEYKMIGYIENSTMRGYIIYESILNKPTRITGNDMKIIEFVYENAEVVNVFSGFFNRQKDQVGRIIFPTQDESIQYLVNNPSTDNINMFFPIFHETGVRGTGIMYRVINVKRLFEQMKNHNFNNENITLSILIEDDFYPENNGETIVKFTDGRPDIAKEGWDVQLSMRIDDFSSMFTCSVNLKSLVRMGCAELSDNDYLNRLDRLFSTSEKPICMTRF